MSDPVTAYIAMGSNLGDRRATIESALAMLGDRAGVTVTAVSELFETAPVGPAGQGAFLNGAAALRVEISARTLLAWMLEVERRHGRVRDPSQRWGPRALDLDLLLYGRSVIDEPGLTVPHPHLHERRFVLEPLRQIAGEIRHPILGQTVQSLWQAISDASSDCCRADLPPNRGPQVRSVE